MKASTLGALCLSVAMGASVFAYSTLTATARDSEYSDGQVIETDRIDAISLAGGGSITVLYGSSPSVKILDGAESLRLKFERGTLEMRCTRPCPRNSRRRIEVTTDVLEALAVTGGGSVDIADPFPESAELSVAVTGGGSLGAYNLPAREVNAAVTGGGSLKVTALEELNAAVMGGGSITYSGDPEVNATSFGGGSINRR